MNEQIENLARQAMVERASGFKEFDAYVFARLIVQECADLFEVEWGGEKLTGNDVANVVKKHFGVK